jgi:hypothetical protein
MFCTFFNQAESHPKIFFCFTRLPIYESCAMTDFIEYTKINEGKQVFISTTGGQFTGVLSGSRSDEEGNISALVIRQYLHYTQIPVEDILNIRLI